MTALVTICAFTVINVNYFGFYFAKFADFSFRQKFEDVFNFFYEKFFCVVFLFATES